MDVVQVAVMHMHLTRLHVYAGVVELEDFAIIHLDLRAVDADGGSAALVFRTFAVGGHGRTVGALQPQPGDAAACPCGNGRLARLVEFQKRSARIVLPPIAGQRHTFWDFQYGRFAEIQLRSSHQDRLPAARRFDGLDQFLGARGQQIAT